MFKKRKPEDVSFYGVALALIVVGAGIVGIGGSFWVLNFFFDYHFAIPSLKFMGGLIIIALGYIVLEMELYRHK